jgi:hypothetical protein
MSDNLDPSLNSEGVVGTGVVRSEAVLPNVLLLQLDGKLPNLALMRIAAHYRRLKATVELRRISNVRSIEAGLWDAPDLVYASLIFTRTLPLALRLREVYPGARIGGTGWNNTGRLSENGIATLETDYSDYPDCDYSMGFVFRGCRMKCPFCVVPQKEGRVQPEQTIVQIWRGDPQPRKLLLLDNDFGGHSTWRERAREIIDGGFKVSFFQGINARLMFEELAEALAAMDLRDGDFESKRFYTAWDSLGDEGPLFQGLRWLVKYGLKPDDIMVYMLCGYCHLHQQAADLCPASCLAKDSPASREHRRRKLREFGCRPYPMPYTRTPELVGFQRWVVRRADLKMSWTEFAGANYRPENVSRDDPAFPMFEPPERALRTASPLVPSEIPKCAEGLQVVQKEEI